MDTHVGSTRLPTGRQGEFVAVSRQVTKAVHNRGRPVRDDTLDSSAFPGKNIGCKLKPGRTEREVVWRRRTREVIHALSHPPQHRCRSQALEGGRSDTRSFGLTASHEPPLVLSDRCESAECGVSSHFCILYHIWVMSQCYLCTLLLTKSKMICIAVVDCAPTNPRARPLPPPQSTRRSIDSSHPTPRNPSPPR